MKNITYFLSTFLFSLANYSNAQNFGIVRENYFSTYYDSILMMNIEVFDSGTIRLGSIDPTTGLVSNVGTAEYNTGINLNGATIDPYSNRYYIGRGFNFLTFDLNTGNIINDVPITGPLQSAAFQNFRFNNSDSTIYGMVPKNFYSTYYDSIAMMDIEVLDSTQIRFASLNPQTGAYTLIGNTSFSNLYTLAGNSIDPYQMIYYYSAVDTLIGIDLYTGETYSTVPIQLPANGIFENIAYSCADTAIYGITRQNFISTVFDSSFMDFVQIIDSTTFRLSKINPNTGEVYLISPFNIGAGGNLTSAAFIDPSSMTYYFSNTSQTIGVSLVSGLITSTVSNTFSSNAFTIDMMRSTLNCINASKARYNNTTTVKEFANNNFKLNIFPNPSQNEINVITNEPSIKTEILDFRGSKILETNERKINIFELPEGIYFAKVFYQNGKLLVEKFIKN